MEDGRTSEAVKILESIVDIEKSRCDEKDDNCLIPQRVLAQAYLNAGRKSEAVSVLEQVARVQALLYDEGHPLRIASEELLDETLAGCNRPSSNSTKTSLSPAENARSDPVVQHPEESASGESDRGPDLEIEENRGEGSNESLRVIKLYNRPALGRLAGRLRTRLSRGRDKAPVVAHPARTGKRPE